jgi:hypothetical protein
VRKACCERKKLYLCIRLAREAKSKRLTSWSERKKLSKKNFRKYLEDMKKSSYLCNRFPKEIPEPIFEKKSSLNN